MYYNPILLFDFYKLITHLFDKRRSKKKPKGQSDFFRITLTRTKFYHNFSLRTKLFTKSALKRLPISKLSLRFWQDLP